MTLADAPPARAAARSERAAPGRAHRVLAIRVLAYVTNHVVSHVPSFALRRAWYRRALGATMGRGAGVHLGCRLTFYGPEAGRRHGYARVLGSSEKPGSAGGVPSNTPWSGGDA